MDSNGVDSEMMADICAALDDDTDYFSLVAGTSAALGASVHIVAPMGVPVNYIATLCSGIRARIKSPLIVTGRINQPQDAEKIIANNEADMCGMTRAMICDPSMPKKAQHGNIDDIRACIGCNQACIGRAHKGLSISCIQHPESGRETIFHGTIKTTQAHNVIVVGGGPAGMKAAAVAAQQGHSVTLYESSAQLGGQVLLAQRLPGREEFGGIVNNLSREMELADVEVLKNTTATRESIHERNPDNVIIATGAHCYVPDLESLDKSRIAMVDDILLEKIRPGTSVVIADWKADWIGLGLAEKLATEGHRVRLYVNAAMVGESLQIYTRNHYVGRLYSLGVEMHMHARLYGAEDDCVYFQNTLNDEPIIVEGVDTLVLSLGHQPNNKLAQSLEEDGLRVTSIGDCVVPRTAEEAVYEGLIAATEIN